MTFNSRSVLHTHFLFIIFFLVSLVFNCSSAYAGGPQKVSLVHQQEFRFTPGARQESQLAVNEILQMLSEGSGKLRVFTSFSAECQITVGYSDTLPGTYTLFLEVDHFRLSGDVEYREFYLTEFMTPPFLDILVQIKADDGRVLKDVALNNIKWREITPGDSLIAFRINGNRFNGKPEIAIGSASFHFGEEYAGRTALLKKSLTSYYEADQLVDKATELIEQIQPQDYERAILDDFKVCEAELIIGKVTYSPFWNVLPLAQNDPLNIRVRLDSVSARTIKLRETFNEILSHLDTHLYETGLDYLEEGQRGKGMELFGRVLVYNPLHIPAHVQLGAHEMASGQSQIAMERFAKLMGEVSPPAQWRDDAIGFVSHLFASEIAKAEEAMEDGRFLDALNILREVEKFCEATRQWDCPVTLQEKITEAHYGMYRSYLSVAKRAYSNRDNSFAVLYAESALDYQQKNNSYIKADTEVTELLQWIANGYFEQITKAFAHLDFALAMKLAGEVHELCTRYDNTGLNCQEDAKLLVNKAEEQKRSAQRMVVPLVLTDPAVVRDELSREQAAERVKDMLSKGHLKAWAGDTKEAREYLNNLMHYAIRYELRKDSILNERIVSLTKMIAAKECEIVYRDIQSTLATLNDYLKRGYYREVRESYDKVILLNESGKDCEWSFSDTIQQFVFVERISEYQQMLHKAQGAYFRAGDSGFGEFIDLYNQAGDFFRSHQLSNYGAEHRSLFEFSANSSNSALIKATILYLSKDGYHPEIIDLLNILQHQGFAAREMRPLQEKAGAQMAIHLHALQPEINPSVFIREKTDNEKWLRSFTRSFTRNWP